MQIKIVNQISDISAKSWNSLVHNNYPFLRHEFLNALEKHGCVGKTFGWIPKHIAIYEENQLIGAMAMYEKLNSYGEFVFDHAWIDAWQRAGLRYFPKFVAAIPYTPATGQRLLAPSERQEEIYPILLETALKMARKSGASGYHCLFLNRDEHRWLENQGMLTRHDCQFHWYNRDYASFDDFLMRLTHKKRKNIRQERRRVQAAGVTLRTLDGYTASDEDWQYFADFYNQIYEHHWGMPTLNYGFFREVAQTLPDQVVLVLADRDNRCIAGALMYRSDTTLYGRHWGCAETIDSLHFEACYYQGIDYCIEQGLQVFEPGAQGEHKIARGFTPTLTRSSHWIAESDFRRAIAAYVRHEQQGVSEYMQAVSGHSPYKDKAEVFR
jgi:predicted N-acyltransferase